MRDSPYRSGRSQTWVKVKCVQQDIFTIVGVVSDGSAVAALHLARREGKSLVYVGKVGTGFSRKVARELHQVLAPRHREAAGRDARARCEDDVGAASVSSRDRVSCHYRRWAVPARVYANAARSEGCAGNVFPTTKKLVSECADHRQLLRMHLSGCQRREPRLWRGPKRSLAVRSPPQWS